MLLGITHKLNNMLPKIITFLETRGNILSKLQTRINEHDYLNLWVECGASGDSYIINTPQAVTRSLSPDHIRQILNINGIQYYNDFDNDQFSKNYEMLIFERSALFIKQKIKGKNGGHSQYIEEEQCKKIVDVAKRVIYLLGLDYGMVHLGLTPNKKIHVLSVNDSPLLSDIESNSLFAEILRVIDSISQVGSKEIKMGADPEFMLSNAKNGQMIPASQFFPREGIVGCDSIRMPNRQQRPVAELRPKPDYSPLQLLSNLSQAMQTANKLVPYRHVKWLAGSRPFNGYSLGGHIHFSNVDLNNHILRALDTYIGLPLFLIENQATAVKRRDKYGFLADYRPKEYGGFEYRTPGSWLVSPQIAAATLCLAKIVASNYLKLTRNCFLSSEAQRAFYSGNQDYLKILFNDVWADIQKLDMYLAYEDKLKIIYDMIKNNRKWEEKEDIRKTWAITIAPKKKNSLTKTDTGSTHSRNETTYQNGAHNPERNQRSPRFNRIRNSGPVYISSQRFYN
ncbi:MAG: hypothetical protein VB084_11025 [Syntrophomonadaceae bacterium]|nr:hypothetical protein [Syntrophomonadaceae bacterium]